jgi:hypothetical protein
MLLVQGKGGSAGCCSLPGTISEQQTPDQATGTRKDDIAPSQLNVVVWYCPLLVCSTRNPEGSSSYDFQSQEPISRPHQILINAPAVSISKTLLLTGTDAPILLASTTSTDRRSLSRNPDSVLFKCIISSAATITSHQNNEILSHLTGNHTQANSPLPSLKRSSDRRIYPQSNHSSAQGYCHGLDPSISAMFGTYQLQGISTCCFVQVHTTEEGRDPRTCLDGLDRTICQIAMQIAICVQKPEEGRVDCISSHFSASI